jgi:hypothetical protein
MQVGTVPHAIVCSSSICRNAAASTSDPPAFANAGSLRQAVLKRKFFDDVRKQPRMDLILEAARQLASGLAHIHSKGIIRESCWHCIASCMIRLVLAGRLEGQLLLIYCCTVGLSQNG